MTQWTVYISRPVGEFYWWPAVQKAKATEFCAVAPDVGASTVWNLLLYVTLLDSRVFRLLADIWDIYAPLLTVKLLSANPGWRFFICGLAQREWTVWTLIARVHWAPGVKCECASWSGITMLGENIIFNHQVLLFFAIRQTQLYGSRIYGLSRYCLHRPSPGRVLVRRKVKRGDACPYRQQV
jgi:hypothetical protein